MCKVGMSIVVPMAQDGWEDVRRPWMDSVWHDTGRWLLALSRMSGIAWKKIFSFSIRFTLTTFFGNGIFACLHFKLLKDWERVWFISSVQHMTWTIESAQKRLRIANSIESYTKHTCVWVCVCTQGPYTNRSDPREQRASETTWGLERPKALGRA